MPAIHAKISRVRVVGAGVMGSGIAQLFAGAGINVEITDVVPAALAVATERIRTQFAREVSKNRMTKADADAAYARVTTLPDPYMPGSLDLVIEVVKEDLDIKRQVLSKLESIISPTTILASNTSSFSITSIGAALADPSRFAGLHFFNPAPLMRVVEVIPGQHTTDGVTNRLSGLINSIGHRPVIAADSPGFVINHAGRGLVTEGLQLLEEGVATPSEIDDVARDMLNLRLGPFELMDLTGLDVTHPVMESIWSGFYGDPRLRPSPLSRLRVDAGLLGRKNGAGFYNYENGKKTEHFIAGAPRYTGQVLWTEDPLLASRLRSADVHLAKDPVGADAILLAPWGISTLDAALAAGLNPALVCGVDPLAKFEGRLAVAIHPGVSPAAGRAALSALTATGQPVTLTRDAPATVAQRLLAAVVNTAAEIAQRRIALPRDIDAAVELGLGYPQGPLAWGDKVGARRILEVLQAMHHGTGDPRYRPSRWLTERVGCATPLQNAGISPQDLSVLQAEAVNNG